MPPTLGLPAPKLVFDQENGAKVSFSVGPQASVPPGGQVSVSAISAATGQTTPLCSGPITSGAGSCLMTTAQLAPGKYLVTVKAGTVKLCVITLNNGKGRCGLTAKKLRVGTYHLVASYPGGTIVAKSASGKVTLVVTK